LINRKRKNPDRKVTAQRFWQTILTAGLMVGLANPTFAEKLSESASQFEIVSSSPDDVLTEKFRPSKSQTFQNSLKHTTGYSGESVLSQWAGADAAYSIPLGLDKTLWLFGDTFLRTKAANEANAASSLTMINNSIAIQHTRDQHSPFNFFWQDTDNGIGSVFEDIHAKQLEHWLWPLDGIYRDGKLYVFVNELKRTEAEKTENVDPAFAFASTNQQLLKVQNPQESLDKWKMTFSKIVAPNVQVGNALTIDDNFVYVFCSYYPAREGMNQHPQIVIRLPLNDLDKVDARDLYKSSDVWSDANSKDPIKPINKNSIEGSWIRGSLAEPKIVMQDGAPEFSVTRVKGIEGFFAVYFPCGFGSRIMLRHASRPEGPWSEPQCIYDCPVDTQRFFVYSAKCHPELCTEDGELCITYCKNIKSSNSDLNSIEPERFYFPHAIKVQLKTVTSRSEQQH
jgi:hypothetical protein